MKSDTHNSYRCSKCGEVIPDLPTIVVDRCSCGAYIMLPDEINIQRLDPWDDNIRVEWEKIKKEFDEQIKNITGI